MDMIIYKTALGDNVHRYQKAIVIPFSGQRNVLSTSPINGGYREDIKVVFNKDENPGAGIACKLRAPTYKEHMELICTELGLDPSETAGISTAASMDNVAIAVETYKQISVTAIVTGGIEVNGGRVGDPASYDEMVKKRLNESGTINIILAIDAKLPASTMTRALVTCTEGKTAAIQELMAGSHYSTGLATGSGTDSTIIVSNMESPVYLTNAGKHSKLGELIGKAVIKAVKEALYKQTGLCAESQHSMLRRFERFGIVEDSLWDRYTDKFKENSLSKPDFIHKLESMERKDKLVTLTSLYIHLMDQFQWGLLSHNEVKLCGEDILLQVFSFFDLKRNKIDIDINVESSEFIKEMTRCFEEVVVLGMGGKLDV